MKQNSYFAYIRVSTVRQGTRGTSLVEQRAAIHQYARQKHLNIVDEYKELGTASKRGRPIFIAMMKALRKGKVRGVIIHKIDRGARNLKDWAELAELLDAGLEVHFANESLDMESRGGRLSADIQAVVAADYIRNLREEVKKGMYGRLKQGLYPMQAPTGYLDMGTGNPKMVDPLKAPLIKKTFELYATGKYGLHALRRLVNMLGLTNKFGSKLSINGVANILHNPFYTGIIHLKKTNEYFTGQHEPIITKDLYDQVQAQLRSKVSKKDKLRIHHRFFYRRLLICKCGNHRIAEEHKGHTYYRCHNNRCNETSVREEYVTAACDQALRMLQFTDEQYFKFRSWINGEYGKIDASIKEQKEDIQLRLGQLQGTLVRLTDLVVSGAIVKSEYIYRKNILIEEELTLKGNLERLEEDHYDRLKELEESFNIARTSYIAYGNGDQERRIELLKKLFECFTVMGSNVTARLRAPFETILTQVIQI